MGFSILSPIDGSDTSERALRFAADLCRRFDGTLHVVHITDVETESTALIMERAREILDEEGIDDVPTISTDLELSFRSSNQIGDDILELVEEGEYDHVVMGHHGCGAIDRIILGSAAETVIRSGDVAVTVVP